MSGYTEYLRSTSTIWFVGFFLALLVFGPMLVFRVLVGVGSGAVATGATVAVAFSVLVLFADAVRRRRSERPAVGPSDGGDGADIWALIPSWPYNGLYAETGASTRDEQEKALQKTHERAAETERRLQKRSK